LKVLILLKAHLIHLIVTFSFIYYCDLGYNYQRYERGSYVVELGPATCGSKRTVDCQDQVRTKANVEHQRK